MPPAPLTQAQATGTLGRRGRGLRAGLATLILLCAAGSVFQSYRNVRPLNHFTTAPWQVGGQDRFSALGRRYLPLRQRLQGLARVGFISSYDHEMGHRMMAQSLAAPTLLMDTDDAPVVVASFENESQLEQYLKGKPLVVRERLGGGLAILEREKP